MEAFKSLLLGFESPSLRQPRKLSGLPRRSAKREGGLKSSFDDAL
jgi:hypothetical protein